MPKEIGRVPTQASGNGLNSLANPATESADSHAGTTDKHISHVDGMRALAVLAVMIYHLNPRWLPGGLTGVDVFFVISGFVVTASLAQHHAESFSAFIARFYHRRLTRILPALVFMLIVTALVYSVFIPRSWLSGMTATVAFMAFFGLSNVALQYQADAYFSPRAEFNPFTHTWSLGVEEQFYLIAPCLVYLHVRALSRAGTRTRAPYEVAILALVSLMAMVYWTRAEPLSAFYSVVSRFVELAAGCLWYLWVWRSSLRAARGIVAWALDIAGVATLAVVFAYTSPERFPFPWALAAVVAAMLLIGVPGRATPFRRILESTPAQYIGLRSYSLYLWHWPVYVMARWTVGLDHAWIWPIAVAITFLLAESSYRWIETPLRASRRWRAMRPSLAIVIAVAATTACGFAAKEMLTNLNSLGISKVTRQRADWYADHDDPTLAALGLPCASQLRYRQAEGILVIEYERVSCRDGTPLRPEGIPSVFVLGDSHATMYLPLLHRLSAKTGANVHVYQIPGCPFLDFRGPVGKGRPAECATLPVRQVADVLARAKSGDLVFLPSLRIPRFVDQWGRMDEAVVLQAILGPGADAERATGVEDAYNWLKPLVERDLKLVFEAPTPIFRSPAFRCADAWTRMNDICSRGLKETREWQESIRAPVLQAMRTVVANTPGASIYDPLPHLCGAAECKAILESGRPLFFDADHLSRYGNEVLYASFFAHLQAIGALPAGGEGSP